MKYRIHMTDDEQEYVYNSFMLDVEHDTIERIYVVRADNAPAVQCCMVYGNKKIAIEFCIKLNKAKNVDVYVLPKRTKVNIGWFTVEQVQGIEV